MQTTTQTTAKNAKNAKNAQAAIVANPANVPASLAPAPVTPAPVTPAPVTPPVNLLATLKAQTPATATSAQLAQAIGAVQGAYQAIQNGVSAPTRGTSCIMVWVAFCNYCVTHQTAPTLAQLAPNLTSVNPTTQSVQFYKVKRYFGL